MALDVREKLAIVSSAKAVVKCLVAMRFRLAVVFRCSEARVGSGGPQSGEWP